MALVPLPGADANKLVWIGKLKICFKCLEPGHESWEVKILSGVRFVGDVEVKAKRRKAASTKEIHVQQEREGQGVRRQKNHN